MRCRARWIAHVMQAVKEGDQIEILLRIALGCRNLETGIRSDAVFPGMGHGLLDRTRMKVVADELRLGEGLGHQHGRPAVAAPYVGDFGTTLQLIDDTVERG